MHLILYSLRISCWWVPNPYNHSSSLAVLYNSLYGSSSAMPTKSFLFGCPSILTAPETRAGASQPLERLLQGDITPEQWGLDDALARQAKKLDEVAGGPGAEYTGDKVSAKRWRIWYDIMMEQNSLKKTFGLEYDKSNQQSGLIKWYNRLIDKSIDDLDVVDVAKMIRQNILRDIAIDRAIELFLNEPFDGEMQDGDLLALLVSFGPAVTRNSRVQDLISIILKLENEFSDFDWPNPSVKMLFRNNLATLKRMLLEN